jgi:hypothetical protein
MHAVLFGTRKGAGTTDSLKTEVANDPYVHIQNKKRDNFDIGFML